MSDLVAQLSTPAPDGACACGLCAHRCTLRPGQAGLCRAIVNQGGALRSSATGRPAALHVDPIERKPLYHVRPGARLLSLGTPGCNMTCSFCQNWRISQARPVEEGEIVTPEQIVAEALAQGCAGIAFTYNEPTIYLGYAAAIMAAAKAAGLMTAFKTNGYMTPEAIAALTPPGQAPLLDAANVDLKGFSEGYYRHVCGARLQPVLDAITELRRRSVWVEVTTLLIPGVNDGDAELGALADWLAALSPDLPWHLWRFHPDYHMADIAPTTVRGLERAAAIGRAAGLRYIYASNAPGDPLQHTRCPGCGHILVERAGYELRSLALHDGCCRQCGLRLPGIFDRHGRAL